MLGLVVFGDISQFMASLYKVDPSSIAGACLLSIINYQLRFVKWHYFLRRLGLASIDMKSSYTTFMSGLSMSVTPGKLGELVKALMLRSSHGVPMPVTASVVIAERATDAFGLALLASLGLASQTYGWEILASGVAVCTVGIAMLRQHDWVLRIIGRRAPGLTSFYEAMYALFSPSRLILTTALSAVSWALEGVAFSVILKGLGVSGLGLDPINTVAIFSFSSLVGALSMLPGGLGAADGSLVGLLMTKGVVRGPASVAALLIRVCTLWLAVGVGLVFLVVSGRRSILKATPLTPTATTPQTPTSH